MPRLQSKTLFNRRTLFIATFTGFALFPALLFYFFSKNLTQSPALLTENAGVLSNQEQRGPALRASAGLPTRLKIPRINVDASFEYVGLAFDGAMDVPKERANVAWFSLGSRPGENGSAVISGHYGWKNEKTSVFDNLHTLRKGDTVYIEDDKGVIISFVVRGIRRYDPNADASDVFSSNDGKSHLNLITCEGVWDKAKKSYSKRLVVFADKE